MKKQFLSLLLMAVMLFIIAPATLAAEGDTPANTIITVGEITEETFAAPAENNSLEEVYVSADGDNVTGEGTQSSPVASLAKAVEVVKDGGTIYVMSDLTANSRALVSGKTITINGNNHTVTRAENFERAIDTGRGGYHSAMIEVANNSELTLVNITLDDMFRREANEFTLAGPSTEDNTVKVHDGIIASYGDGHSTIILASGATLKNFGGLSAVYITGENGTGATLIMETGSKICDDKLGNRAGGYAAVFNHGGTIIAKAGSSIESIDGRAIYADNGGVTTFAGSIKDITSNEVMKESSLAKGGGFAGMAYFGQGDTKFTLAEGGEVTDIKTHNGIKEDVVLHLIGCTFTMEEGSKLHGLGTVGIADMNGATVDIAGSVYDCDSKNVLFRLRGTKGDFYLRKSGSIKNCKTTDVGIMYLNGGKPTIEIAGTIDEVNKPALYISSNGSRKDGTITLTETGVISNVTGYGMRLEDPSHVTIEGTITNCSSYALQYYPKSDQSLLTIKSTATIENNNGGNAQVRAQNSLPATNAQEHIVIETGAAINGNKTIDLTAFDVTLDEEYDTVKLGNANSGAATAIKKAVADKHSDWTTVGSSAVWIQPSKSDIHFTVPRSSSMKKTALFAALLPLNVDGTPQEGAELILQDVQNTGPVDVTLTGLTAGKSYAMMFVNNNEYTLAPDDITIYTGGGQGNETYDDGGFPAITLLNSIDLSFVKNPVTNEYGYDLKSLTVKGKEYTASAEDLLVEQLESLVEAVYTYEDGTVATDDSKPGEYTVTLKWKDGLTNEDVRIDGNNVNLSGEGTLIVRYIEETEEAKDGTNTYELLTADPTASVKNAVAIAKKSSSSDPSFYTNDDEDREVDAGGIQLLDDALLIDDDGTDRQALLEAKATDHLGAPGEGQVYRYDFHYLDLVDAFNGNAWVSASYGTTVYLPYPDGVNASNAESLGLTVVHFIDLHREYGIAGQAEVEAAIEACKLETVQVTYDANGIKFDVAREGFSPFAVVWQTKAHTITATAGVGGTIDPTGTVIVAEGEDQTFTITPSAGYQIADLKVDGVSQGAVSSYTFEKVTTSHTIEATFKPTSTYIPPVHPADPDDTGVSDLLNTEDHIQYLFGYPDSTFCPENNMTRAEVAQMFYNLLLEQDVEITKTFEDVPADAWYTKAVNTLASLDIISGVGSNKFEPNRSITRAEFTAMAMKFAVGGERGENIFSDVDKDDWFYDAVVNSIQYGWIHGYGDGTFRPQNPINRAEVTAIVNNMLGRAADEDFVNEHAEELTPFSDIEEHWAFYHIVEATNDHDYTKTGSTEKWTRLDKPEN